FGIVDRMLGCLLVSSFPLACELAEHPELGGQPAVVGGDDGRVRCASPAAQAYGIRPEQTLSDAIGRCPTVAVLEDRPARDEAVWREIVEALELVAFTVEVRAPGEVYVDLQELLTCYRSVEGAIDALLHTAPSRLEPRVGVGRSRFVALLAANQAASGRGFVVGERGLSRFLSEQPVGALPVSAEMLRRLDVLGLARLGDLRALRRSALAAQFGPEGTLAWDLAQGAEDAPLRPRPRRQQLEERLSLEAPLVSRPALAAAWQQTLSRLVRRPSFRDLTARQIVLAAATERGRQWSHTVTCKEPLGDQRRMWSAVAPVIENATFPGPLSELRVELQGLLPASGQQLALPNARAALRGRLEDSMRQLKARYGYCPVGRVVEMEPWSRIPERRLALIDFDC
ncbi:MAG: DNA polymerase Y family protein, partial [Candidatus Dormiibacterota bacterium]